MQTQKRRSPEQAIMAFGEGALALRYSFAPSSPRRQIVWLSLFLLISIVPAPVSAQSGGKGAAPAARYTVTDLGPCGERTEPGDINEDGSIVGYCYMGQDEDGKTKPERAFLWQRGRLVELQVPDARARAINNRGQVVGGSTRPVTRVNEEAVTMTLSVLQAFLWQAERVVSLPGLGGAESSANDINNVGQIVGSAQTKSDVSHAVLWEPGKGTDLGALMKLEPSTADGINDHGEVIVHSGETVFGAVLPQHAYLWRKNTSVALGTLGGKEANASAINNRTEIVGESQLADGDSHAFLWSNGQMKDLGTLPGFRFSQAIDINNHGLVVGNCQTGKPEFRAVAVLWESGRPIDLNSLVPSDSGWKLEFASAINDRGLITGRGTYNGRMRAFLLTPVGLPKGPPPSTQGSTQLQSGRIAKISAGQLLLDANPSDPEVRQLLTFTLTPHTAVFIGADAAAIQDVRAGDSVMVRYVKEAGGLVALEVRIAPSRR